ncbi:MAG: hypothetical protein LUF89_03715 [Ruminococcus sp.]|nr:hypothetical protein [Ruminococcus sp.]
MPSEIIVALIGAAVTIGNVLFTTLMNAKEKKAARLEMQKAEQNGRTKKMENGLQCLLRSEIIRAHDKYMERGFCPIYARETLAKAYEAYHALGGNGTITVLYHQVTELPTEKGGEGDEVMDL